jgi:hypothetical protein
MPHFLLALARVAAAQDFSADLGWAPLPCVDPVMTDPYRDESGALGERDLVGDDDAPTGLRAVDDAFAYFRVRLDDDAAPNGAARPFAWGIELDADGDTRTYEALVLVNGLDEQVLLYENTEVTLIDDPTDPPDAVAFAEHPLAERTRSGEAGSSTYGDDADYFLDVAVSWDELATVGLSRTSPLVAWYATSSTDTSLNGDFACHDGTSGRDKSLSEAAGSGTVLDPEADTDGDGYTDAVEVETGTDPTDGGSVPEDLPLDALLLEGGGGCASAGGAAFPSGALVGLLAALRRRARPKR